MARTKCRGTWKVSLQIAHSTSRRWESATDGFERSPGGGIGTVPTQLFHCRLSKQTLGMNPHRVPTLPKMKGMFGSLTWRQSQMTSPSCAISQGSGNASRLHCENNEGEKSNVTNSMGMMWVHHRVDAHNSSQNRGICLSSEDFPCFPPYLFAFFLCFFLIAWSSHVVRPFSHTSQRSQYKGPYIPFSPMSSMVRLHYVEPEPRKQVHVQLLTFQLIH